MRERIPRAEGRRPRPRGDQVVRLRAAAGDLQRHRRAQARAGADRQTLGPRARARRRQRRVRLARDRQLGEVPPGDVAGAHRRLAPAPAATSDRRHANSTAATDVARFRLDTPARIGMLIARVGAREQLRAEPDALGAEREHRARGQLARRQRRAVAGRAPAAAARRPRARRARARRATGSAKCSPAAPRSASGCPRVVAAGAQHAGGVGGRGDAHARPHVAEVARVLEQHDAARRARRRARRPRSTRRRCGERDHAGRRRQRRELREHARARPRARARGSRCAWSGASCSARRREPLDVAADDLVHVGAEAQRVLERVKPFEHGELRIAPGAAEARDQRAFLHAAIMSAEMKLEGIHHITAITGDALGNVEFYTGVLGPADGQEERQPGRPDRLPPVLRRRRGLAGDGPDVLRVPRRGARASPAPAWSTGSSGGSPRRASLEFWEERLEDARRRPSSSPRTAACASPTPRGSSTSSCVATAPDAAAARDRAGDPRRARAAGLRRRARVQPPTRRAARGLLLDTLGFTTSDGQSWEVRGEQRGSFYAYDPAPPEALAGQGAGTRAPRRVRGARRGRGGVARARRRRPARIRRR